MKLLVQGTGLLFCCFLMAAPVLSEQERVLPETFAEVNGEKISLSSFAVALRREMREKYYHGKIPEAEIEGFQRGVSSNLIERVLMLQEAKKRKLQPEVDEKKITNRLKALDQANSEKSGWELRRAELEQSLREEAEQESLLEKLASQVRSVESLSRQSVKEYYLANPSFFTTPEKLHVSTILLKVDPSSGNDVWQAAVQTAEGIVDKIRKGVDFSELARVHSADDSAKNGGDMGYLHKGMLAVPVQKILDFLDLGEVSEPVVLLSGVGIFRVEDKSVEKLNDLDLVYERAESLLMREQGERQWQNFLEGLHSSAIIKVNEEVFEL